MPVHKLELYQIHAGHIPYGDLDSDDIISNFPVQTDQSIVPWAPPSTKSTPPRCKQLPTLGNSVRKSGKYYWKWQFSYQTYDMYAYWVTTFIGTGESGLVTAMAYLDTEEPAYFHAVIVRPTTLSNVIGGYADVDYEFIKGVRIA